MFVVFFGVCCFITAVIADKLGGVLEAAMSVNSIVFSPTLGLFILAIYVDRCNKFGAILGYSAGVVTGTFLFFMNKNCGSGTNGEFIEGYFKNKDFSGILPDSEIMQGLDSFYENGACSFYLSYLYISVCGLFVSLSFGMIGSVLSDLILRRK